MGKISYIRRFASALSELIEPFYKLLKKNVPFQWKAEHRVAFQRIKDLLSSTQTMISPVKGIPLTLYLTSTDKSIGALLAQELKGAEHPVYYFSRSLRGAKTNYFAIERHCLALVFGTQKLRNYFLNLVTKSNPLRCLLSRLAMSGRTARQILQLNEYDIIVIIPKKLRSQALSDLIAQFPSEKCEPPHEELSCEKLCSVDTKEWRLAFNGSSTPKKAAGELFCTTQRVLVSSYPSSRNSLVK